ncbi:MAG: transporter associated domain-containing protein, partial [Halieaceae bacterium]|nr:transporter associated domain-containing protein [Halieaceae bacterium]
ILEQVVGEVAQLDHRIAEHPVSRRARIERLERGRYRIEGRALLVDVAESVGVTLPESRATTLGGFIINNLRRLPREGDTITVAGYRLTVEAMNDRSVRAVLAEPD